MCEVMGRKVRQPRHQSASNIWRRSFRKEIEAEASREVETQDKSRKRDLASIREQVAKRMFEALTKEEKDEWTAISNIEHEENMMNWRKVTSGDFTDPADRQRYLYLIFVSRNYVIYIVCAESFETCLPSYNLY